MNLAFQFSKDGGLSVFNKLFIFLEAFSSKRDIACRPVLVSAVVHISTPLTYNATSIIFITMVDVYIFKVRVKPKISWPIYSNVAQL